MLLNTALIIRNVGSQIQWPCTCQVASSLFPYLSIILSNTGSLRYLWLIQVWSLYRDLYFGWVLLATYIMVSAPRVFMFSNSLNVMTPAEWTNGLIKSTLNYVFQFLRTECHLPMYLPSSNSVTFTLWSLLSGQKHIFLVHQKTKKVFLQSMVTLYVCGRNLKFDVHSSVLDLGITIAGS